MRLVDLSNRPARVDALVGSVVRPDGQRAARLPRRPLLLGAGLLALTVAAGVGGDAVLQPGSQDVALVVTGSSGNTDIGTINSGSVNIAAAPAIPAIVGGVCDGTNGSGTVPSGLTTTSSNQLISSFPNFGPFAIYWGSTPANVDHYVVTLTMSSDNGSAGQATTDWLDNAGTGSASGTPPQGSSYAAGSKMNVIYNGTVNQITSSSGTVSVNSYGITLVPPAANGSTTGVPAGDTSPKGPTSGQTSTYSLNNQTSGIAWYHNYAATVNGRTTKGTTTVQAVGPGGWVSATQTVAWQQNVTSSTSGGILGIGGTTTWKVVNSCTICAPGTSCSF
ncbi:MAG: hypothetical protein LBB54_03050 [Cellulomonadaceae bacterium]|jgi:hypothetical protein|nr:hypothetical protein [Cellulomonadaceae bacterium]